MISTLLLSLTFTLLQGPTQRPGLVEIPAGNVTLGASESATKDRIRKDPVKASIFAGELPRASVAVEGFFISPTPITNEMYLEFVNATGAVPPPTWASISAELKNELIFEGKGWVDGKQTNPAYKFDETAQAEWWKEHWQDEGQEWDMPGSLALEPVVFISFMDAQDYCEWIGMRLPTELEWVRAARGDTDWDYPYGHEFSREKSSSISTKPSTLAFKRLPVGTFDNPSPFGIYDMVGQVHEFTDSKATKLEGYKSFNMEIKNASGKKEKIYPDPVWDQSRIILKGGCCELEEKYMRIDSRYAYEKTAAVKLVGFRVAASKMPLKDAAYLKTRNMRSGVLGVPPASGLDYSRTLGMEQFTQFDLAKIESKRATHDALEALKLKPNVPESYAVFGPHRSMTLTPLRDPFEIHKWQGFSKVDKVANKDGRFVPIGALSTAVGFADYDVPAGTYTLVYMAGLKKKTIERMGGWMKGKDKPGTDGEPVEIKDPLLPSVQIKDLELVPDRRYILITDGKGVALAAIPLIGAPVLKQDKQVAHGMNYNEKTEKLQVNFRVAANRGKAYGFTFAFKLADADGKNMSNPADWK